MRIALVTRRFDPAGGGTERDLIITARLLSQVGHRVTIYAAEVRAPADEWPLRRIAASHLGRALELLWFARAAGATARREGTDVVMSFARIVDADILRSGGGAHSSYLRAARQWQTTPARIAMRLSPYHRVQMLVERSGFRSRAKLSSSGRGSKRENAPSVGIGPGARAAADGPCALPAGGGVQWNGMSRTGFQISN